MVKKLPMALRELLVDPGDPLSARAWNTIVDTLASELRVGRGLSGIDKIPMRFKNPDKIRAANRTIPQNSICVPIADVTVTDRYNFVVQDVDYYTDTPVEAALSEYYFTNGNHKLLKNQTIRAMPIVDFRPYLIAYTGTAPTYGDELDVTDSTFTLSVQAGGEFKAISEPDTNRQVVWVMRKRASTSIEIGKLKGTLGTGAKGTVFEKYVLTSGVTPVSAGEPDVEVLNITGITLQPGLYHYKFSITDFYIDIVWPEEIEECITPLVEVQGGAV